MKWALVLSGGGARGLAHIGILEVLEEMGVPQPSMVIGCSMGAIIGGMYASGMKPADMRAYMETNKYPFFGGSRNTVLRVGKGIKNLFLADGLDSGKTMYQILMDLTKGATFAETRIPFYCNSTDLNTGREIVPENGLIADAIRASASFPGVFSPYKKDGMLLVDGYIRHNPPVWIARDHGIKNVLAVYLDRFGRIKPEDMKSPLDILMRSFDCAIGTKLLTQKDIPTARINAANDRTTFDFDRPHEQIDFGRKIAMEQRGTIDAFFAPGFRGMINRAQLAKKEQKEHIHEHP